MKFTGPIHPTTQARIDSADVLLKDPSRLKALKRTGLMSTPREESFDRLAALAARILKAPLTIISLVSDQKQFFKAAFGLPSPMDVVREIPIDGSICRYTLKGERIIANDAGQDPLLQFHPATSPWGIGAFIAIPMITREGFVLGAFCAVHPEAHTWTADEINVMEELTSSVMTEIHLREQINELTMEKDLRERFVLTLTHDLRTPLTSSKLSAQMIATGKPAIDKIQGLAGRITTNIDRADRMIQDMLDANKIKGGQELPLSISEFGIKELAQLTIEDLVGVHGPRFELVSAFETQVNLDRIAIRRMLENLINNAIKYGTENSAIKLIIQSKDNMIEMHVHNTGNPISESDLVTIFEPFHRTKEATQSGQKGWGLGLTLVRSFAEALKGKVSVKSSEQEGTTFSIILPVNFRD